MRSRARKALPRRMVMRPGWASARAALVRSSSGYRAVLTTWPIMFTEIPSRYPCPRSVLTATGFAVTQTETCFRAAVGEQAVDERGQQPRAEHARAGRGGRVD